MRYLISILIVCFISSNSYAKKKHDNPGDVLLTVSGNVFDHKIKSEVRKDESETLTFGQAKLAYHIVHGLYAGGVYHRMSDDENSKNTFGVNLTYVYKTFHIGASYLFHSNHKVKVDTVGEELDAELEKGKGFLIDASYNFPVTHEFYIGIGLSYFMIDYDEVDYEDTLITDSSVSDKETYFMPMMRFTYFFGTHGKRVHEAGNNRRR